MYRNLVCSARGIAGDTRRFGGTWIRFSASPDLFLVNLAMDLNPKTISKFMALADGYGQKGFFPGGYDWSGIRDSTREARLEMADYARSVLCRWPPAKFLSLGLSQEVLNLHIYKKEAATN